MTSIAPNGFDIALGLLILFLGLKGILNGVRKEALNFLGIIGGVFVASRLARPLTRWALEHQFQALSPATMELLAFLLVFLALWGGTRLLGRLLGVRETPEGTIDRLLGYLLATLRYFLVVAIIVSALFQSQLFRDKFAGKVQGSLLYPVLRESGAYLLHQPPVTLHTRAGQSRKR